MTFFFAESRLPTHSVTGRLPVRSDTKAWIGLLELQTIPTAIKLLLKLLLKPRS